MSLICHDSKLTIGLSCTYLDDIESSRTHLLKCLNYAVLLSMLLNYIEVKTLGLFIEMLAQAKGAGMYLGINWFLNFHLMFDCFN